MALQVWTGQTVAQTDPDSPGDTTLMASIRTDLVHLRQTIYGNGSGGYFTPIDGHDHDGLNSKDMAPGSIGQTELATGSVGIGELKSGLGAVSTSSASWGSATLPGGANGFYPQIRMSSSGSFNSGAVILNNQSRNGWVVYATNISLISDGSATVFAQQAYIIASPPYKLGDHEWKHFLFLLRDKITGKVISVYDADTPPWQYNGKIWLPKDHDDRIEAIPHPFADYWDKDPGVDGLEIVLVNLNEFDHKGWKDDNKGKHLLDDIQSVLPGKGVAHHVNDFGVGNINGFSDRVKIVTA